jgi:hypothetical protein
MRKLTASILATATLAGGAFSGVAVAASPPTHPSVERASADHSTSKQDRAEHQSRHERNSRDRVSSDSQRAESPER